MTALLVIVYVLVCLFLILVVLLQQGKGADLAGAFGGGGSQTSFGPRSATSIMHRLTTVSFVLFVILSLGLAILQGRDSSSVMEDLPQQAPAPAAGETQEIPLPATDDGAPADTAFPAEEPAAADEPVLEEGAGEPAPTGQEP